MLEPGQEGAYVSLHHCLVQVCGALAGIGCVALGSRGGEDNLQPSEQGRGMFEKVVLAAGEAASGGLGPGAASRSGLTTSGLLPDPRVPAWGLADTCMVTPPAEGSALTCKARQVCAQGPVVGSYPPAVNRCCRSLQWTASGAVTGPQSLATGFCRLDPLPLFEDIGEKPRSGAPHIDSCFRRRRSWPLV